MKEGQAAGMEISTIIFFCLYVPEEVEEVEKEERSGKRKAQKSGANVFSPLGEKP